MSVTQIGITAPIVEIERLAKKSSSYLLITCCAGSLAALSGWVVGDELFMRHTAIAATSLALPETDIYPIANRDTKQDRHIAAVKLTEDAPVAPSLAAIANFESARAELTQEPPREAVAPAPVSPPKPVVKPVKPSRAFLNDTQIAAIRQRLNLDDRQQKHWPPVEKALRGLTEQIMDYQKRLKKRDDSFDTESVAIKDLKAASKTLLTHLRDEQKSEVLMLARMAGLGSVLTELSSTKQVAKNEK